MARLPAARAMFNAALVLGAAAAAAAGGPAAEPTLELRIAVVNLSRLWSGGMLWATTQAGRSLTQAGVRVTVTRAEAGTPAPPGTLLLILLPGDRPPVDGAKTVGSTSARLSSVSAIWLAPEAIALSLGLDPEDQSPWKVTDDLRLRRAVSSVIVHELLHRLAAAPHAPAGVMAPVLDERTLERDSRVDPLLFPALRRGVAAVAAGDPATRSTRAPAPDEAPVLAHARP